MDIRIHSWNDVSSEEIAQFSFKTRQQDDLIIETPSLDTFRNAITWWKNRSNSTPIIAYIGNQVVGWLVIFSFVPTTVTIGRWHPIVKPGPEQKKTSEQLLQKAIVHAKEQGFERFEAELTGITQDNETVYEVYREWYEAQGMYLATEEARLERDLTQEPLPEPAFPAEFQLYPISQFSNEELEAPFFEMFDESMDRFWLDQSVEQRKESYAFWFDRSRPFVDKATAVLLKGSEIVGLTIVRPIQEIGMLGPIAIKMKYRRQGLGRSLMAHSMQGALQSGIPKLQLEFDTTNKPALQLYTELGFTHVHCLALFALSL
jgi:ribosomal protein S18 acetylase RimI-like enzyme